MSVLSKKPHMTDGELLTLFKNALDLLARDKSVEQANLVIMAIQSKLGIRT